MINPFWTKPADRPCADCGRPRHTGHCGSSAGRRLCLICEVKRSLAGWRAPRYRKSLVKAPRSHAERRKEGQP
jgi:CRISPR/Cas system-associated protein Cas10 (large subunit of type III CRISPR-Cas system)